ncbi:MAG: carbohydrate ABC transporter permease [Ignavibacteriales bacterium]|nr:carbohydrate ABC transporter permease [Ignavibacteriales bacterium]
MSPARKIISYSLLLIGTVAFIYPFVWMVMASLAPEKEIASFTLFPSNFGMSSYLQVFEKIPVLHSFFNSMVVSLSVTFFVVVFSSMTGFALTHYEFKGREVVFYIIIFTMSLPFQLTLIPQYILMVKFGWVDTYLALTVPYFINGLGIIIFRQYFKTIPRDLFDAARIDGCNDMKILFSILLPNAKPAVITVAILTFMGVWNDVLWPIIVIRNENLMTLPQLITLFAVGGKAESQLGVKLASAVMLALPVVIAYSVFQKYFITSMASSGLKE